MRVTGRNPLSLAGGSYLKPMQGIGEQDMKGVVQRENPDMGMGLTITGGAEIPVGKNENDGEVWKSVGVEGPKEEAGEMHMVPARVVMQGGLLVALIWNPPEGVVARRVCRPLMPYLARMSVGPQGFGGRPRARQISLQRWVSKNFWIPQIAMSPCP